MEIIYKKDSTMGLCELMAGPRRRFPNFTACCLLTLSGVLHAVSTVTAQGSLPTFLEAVPKKRVDAAAETRRLIEQLAEIEDVEHRVEVLKSLAALLPLSPAINVPLRDVVAQTIEDSDASDLWSIKSVVAYFPGLQGKVLERVDDPETRDAFRLQSMRYVADYKVAGRVFEQLETPRYRRLALSALFRRAPSLEEKLELLEKLASLQKANDPSPYGEFLALHEYAADSPEIVRDFVERIVPADESIWVFVVLAERTMQENPDAAAVLLDAAWSRLPDTTKPYEHAPLLLKRDFRGVDRDTWLSTFDKYVLPALRGGKTHIGALGELARFGIDVVNDRTKKSVRGITHYHEGRLPHVMDDAFSVNPDGVLAWLETADAEIRDQCILEITEFLSLQEQFRDPSHRIYLMRLCELAIGMQHPKQQMVALAQLARELPRLEVTVPDRVIQRGRFLLDRHADFDSLDLYDKDDSKLFWLATPDQRKQLIETHLSRLRGARRAVQYQLGHLCSDISQSGLPVEDQVKLFRRMEEIAESLGNRYLQARVASSAVRLDATWAVKTMWDILPKGRERGVEREHREWSWPPTDAGHAIDWLKRDLPEESEAVVETRLMTALWKFLPTAPAVDRDAIRLALCDWLVQRRHFEQALGLAEQIDFQPMQAKARLHLVCRVRSGSE